MGWEPLLSVVRDRSIAFIVLPAFIAAAVFTALDRRIVAMVLLAIGSGFVMTYLERRYGFVREPWWMAGVAIMLAGTIVMVGTRWQGAWWIIAVGVFLPQAGPRLRRRGL